MRTLARYLIPILALLLAAIGCSEDETASNPQDKPNKEALLPDAIVRGATIYLYDKGRVTAQIDAEKIIKFESVDSTVAHVVEVDAFDSTGAVETHVVGDSGIIREQTGEMYIYGNVDVKTDDNSRLETEYLYWDSENELLKSDRFVKITKEKDVITGIGLETDQRLQRIKILEQVSGELHDAEQVTE